MSRAGNGTSLRKIANSLATKGAVMYVLGHALDLVTTYLSTPQLAKETNLMVARFGFGWTYLLISAAVSSLIMLVALLWMWRRLVERLPGPGAKYGRLYRSILFGSPRSNPHGRRTLASGAFIGLVSITAYAVIAAKLLTCAWNLNVLMVGMAVEDFALMLLLKNGVAATVGLFMFFVYPYLLYRGAR